MLQTELSQRDDSERIESDSEDCSCSITRFDPFHTCTIHQDAEAKAAKTQKKKSYDKLSIKKLRYIRCHMNVVN
jgi:hypothetical protein